MKRNRLSIVLLSLFLVVLLGSAFSIEGVSTNDLNFTFEKDIYYESTNPDYHESFNVRNQTEFTGHYPATYSFENDIGKGLSELDFVDYNTSLNGFEVLDNYEGHEAVINISSTVQYSHLRHFYPNLIEGELEFWCNGITGYGEIYLQSGSTILCIIRTTTTYIRFAYGDGVGGVLYASISVSGWNHVKVIFNCTSDTWSAYLNGNMEIEDENFYLDHTGNIMTIQQNGINSVSGSVLYDAFGYSWDKTGYTGTSFDLSGEGTEPLGITWDGSNYWICFTDLANNGEIYRYTDAGVYTGVHFDVSIEDKYPMGLTWNGIYIWMVGSFTDEVYQYTSAGVYTGVHFDVGTEDGMPVGITWDGTHFWIVGDINDEVYQYNSAGVYTGVHFDTNGKPSDITWDGNYLWILKYTDEEVCQYTSAGVYTGVHFDVGTEDIAPEGLLFLDGYFWMTGLGNVKAYEYEYIEVPYNIGDNMISTSNKTGILDVNRYEFKYKQWNDMVLTENGRDNVNTWTDIEGGGGDQVNYQNTGNGVIEILNSADYDEGTGIKKNDFSITSNRVNVSVGFELIDMTSVISSHFDIYLNSSDGSEVVRIYIDKDGDLGYYDSGDIKVVLNTGLLEGVFYEVNLFVNYYDEICVLRYNADGVFVDWYLFPLKTTGKSGLKGVRCELECSTSGHQVDLEYVGVYDEGVSVSWEFAFQSITPNNLWYYYRNSLLEFTVNSEDFCIYVDIFPSLSALERLITLDDYSGINRVDVRGELSGDYSSNLQPIFYFQFKNLEFFDFSIEGVKLNESSNSYWMDFTYENVNLEESYFYVDSDNRLQFSLICNDNYSEYIQATFDIQNIATENRSISFYSNINGNSKGYFALDYESAISTAIEFPYYARATRVILAQTEYINSFTILITDNDLDDDDACEGYITSVKLIYYPDIATTITTLSLLGILVPLIVMIAPPLALYKKFGSGVILPMFILMSLICVLTNLIPVWLFFIIAFSSIGFLLMKKKVEVAF